MFDSDWFAVYYLSGFSLTRQQVTDAYNALSASDKELVDQLYTELLSVSESAKQPYLIQFSEARISDSTNSYINEENKLVEAILKLLGFDTSEVNSSEVYYVG